MDKKGAMFDYQGCNQEELVSHIKASSRQTIGAARSYYVNKGFSEVVDKIDAAKLVVKRDKLRAKLEELGDLD